MQVRCPDCASIGTASAELAGQMVRCARCRREFTAEGDLVLAAGIKWYYALGDEKQGPINEAEFDRLVAAGDIAPNTLVWCKGMSGWQSLLEVQGEPLVAVGHEELPLKMKVRCPDCGSRGTLSIEVVGKIVRCSRCGGKSPAQEDLGGEVEIKWYYALGAEKKGPLSPAVFEQLIASGDIVPSTLVWCKGMPGWQSLLEVRGPVADLLAGEELPQERELGAEAIPEAALSQAPDRRPVGGPSLPYAGAGARLVAKLIDIVFMFALASLVEGLSRKLFPESFGVGGTINSVYLVTMFICFLCGMAYITWFVGKFGATPGKMVMNLKVVTATGGKINYRQAFGRYWAESVVVVLSLLLGYLPIFFDPQRRGLHDRLCATRVVVA
ncbi:MAG: DUF4339 domain-containing protein [Desulfobulbaceae bacterium]|nr:DUF4339 domain-containing protein [Desulfobulbaceae bacterium]